MKYQEIKTKKDKTDTNKLFTDLGIFWAFSNEQFDQGYAKVKPTMQEGEKLTSIGAGGYIPTSRVQAFLDGMKAIEKSFKQGIKNAKARNEHILYELNNHESFYTGSIEHALIALGDDYTAEEVTAVYKEYKKAKYKQDLSIEEITAVYE